MSTPFKICGLSTPATVDAAIAAGAAHLGFVFFPPSPRHLDPAGAGALVGRVPPGIGRVAVLVDPDDALVAAVLGTGITILQLHGAPPGRVAALKASTGLPVWSAHGVATRAEITHAREAAGPADLLLLDAKAPSSAPLPGGNGLSFDWRLLDGLRPDRPFGLAGGLDPANVGEAVAAVRPALVDVSSGVEDAPGVKSVMKINSFAAAVRAAR